MEAQFQEVISFLSARFRQVVHLQHLADGWWSRAYSFECEEGKLVIRLNEGEDDFLKDKYAFENFRNPEIPIPECRETGRFNDSLFYCLSSFKAGTPANTVLESLDDKVALSIAPSILEPLYHIHNIDVSRLQGWGRMDGHGVGGWSSWPEFLSSVGNGERASWKELGNTTWLDSALFAQLLTHMQEYFHYLPREKKLMHGDYGFDNLLLNDDHKVTAVLDWADMSLGDELYDLIHMNEPWRDSPDEIQYLPVWLQYKKRSKDGEIPNFQQRLECYRIHYTLVHLHIHTVRKEEKEYTEIEQWARRYLI